MNTVPRSTSNIELSPTLTKYPRPRVKGKFIFIGDEKFYVRGVTYGTFRPDEKGNEYPKPEIIEKDFEMMVSNRINAIRTYSVPPLWLLDFAQEKGLHVMVGMPWEQHITFLDEKKRTRNIVERIRAGVRKCEGHPAVLCYAIGNEIPSPIVRWYGRSRIEHFLEKLYNEAKTEDPKALYTYVNYPTTEYLNLSFLDILCFNVYLETQESLEAYIYKLHNIAGDKPLLMAEIGLDSLRNGKALQANSLDCQIRAAFNSGCIGTFVFAWTDEWYRGGYDIEDWDFGLTTRNRFPKPALASVLKTYSDVPFNNISKWPTFSVVVCTYNGKRTIGECLEGISRIEYPYLEVIVVNDGSDDASSSITSEIANKYGFKLIKTENRGLGNARNTGIEAATGEIITFIDDDAYPDPHWLTYLASEFMKTKHVGIGGPNIPPKKDGNIAECIANSPGNPIHVLISDQEAEHIAGCNMAFRKSVLEEVGGFDNKFRIAGDDVDVCWRLRERGYTLGFSPAAVVWHHPRNSVLRYLKQQFNYGKAETLLEKKWPDKYNEAGHITWKGRMYGNGFINANGWFGKRIYQGVWGSAYFQSLYETPNGTVTSLLLMPEWYLVIVALFSLSIIGIIWSPMLYTLPIMTMAIIAPVVLAIIRSNQATFNGNPKSKFGRLKLRGLTATLYLLQPLARLLGRLSHGLTPWRRRGQCKLSVPWPRTSSFWCERWQAHEKRLESIEKLIRNESAIVKRGGTCDNWDLEVRGGLFGGLKVLMAIEEHGAGKQMVRLRYWPNIYPVGLILTLAFGILATLAAIDHSWFASILLASISLVIAIRSTGDCGFAMAYLLKVIKKQDQV